jgi:DNA-binding PadR family transcriptional regulator
VFPEKLSPGLSLDRRENNHRIKVILEARPAKRNYYRLTPKKMEELKKKLEEYIELGHIRSSKSL